MIWYVLITAVKSGTVYVHAQYSHFILCFSYSLLFHIAFLQIYTIMQRKFYLPHGIQFYALLLLLQLIKLMPEYFINRTSINQTFAYIHSQFCIQSSSNFQEINLCKPSNCKCANKLVKTKKISVRKCWYYVASEPFGSKK